MIPHLLPDWLRRQCRMTERAERLLPWMYAAFAAYPLTRQHGDALSVCVGLFVSGLNAYVAARMWRDLGRADEAKRAAMQAERDEITTRFFAHHMRYVEGCEPHPFFHPVRFSTVDALLGPTTDQDEL